MKITFSYKLLPLVFLLFSSFISRGQDSLTVFFEEICEGVDSLDHKCDDTLTLRFDKSCLNLRDSLHLMNLDATCYSSGFYKIYDDNFEKYTLVGQNQKENFSDSIIFKDGEYLKYFRGINSDSFDLETKWKFSENCIIINWGHTYASDGINVDEKRWDENNYGESQTYISNGLIDSLINYDVTNGFKRTSIVVYGYLIDSNIVTINRSVTKMEGKFVKKYSYSSKLHMTGTLGVSKFFLMGFVFYDVFFMDYSSEYILILNNFPEMLERIME